MTLGTFHSLCLAMLRRDIESLQKVGLPYRRGFAVYDETDSLKVVRHAAPLLKGRHRPLWDYRIVCRTPHGGTHPQPFSFEMASLAASTACTASSAPTRTGA
eukprot:scaffold155393_cov25-Tisochrysis_lutea.AAC.2